MGGDPLKKKFASERFFCWRLRETSYICTVETVRQLKLKAMTTQMTIREIRRVLFDRDIYTVIGANEMSNKESRDLLYSIDDQEQMMNVIDNTSHLLIWN